MESSLAQEALSYRRKTMLCKVTRELGFCLIYKNASSSVRMARPMRPVTPAEFLVLPGAWRY